MGQINQKISILSNLDLSSTGSDQVIIYFDSNKRLNAITFDTASNIQTLNLTGSVLTASLGLTASSADSTVLFSSNMALTNPSYQTYASGTFCRMQFGGLNMNVGTDSPSSNYFPSNGIAYNFVDTGSVPQYGYYYLYSGSFIVHWGIRSSVSASYKGVELVVSASNTNGIWKNFGEWKYGDAAYGYAQNGGNLEFGGGTRITDVIYATESMIRIGLKVKNGTLDPGQPQLIIEKIIA